MAKIASTFIGILGVLGLLCGGWVPPVTAQTETSISIHAPDGADQRVPTPTPTSSTPSLGPDRCEPNPDVERACVLGIDTVNGPYTFLPLGDRDYYSLDLGAQPSGLQTIITVRGTAGLDLRTTMTPAGGTTPLATVASPAISTTVPLTTTGWIVLRVENRSPRLPTEETYGIEVRQQLPPPPAPDSSGSAHPGAPSQAPPDLLENNYDIGHAAPIAIGAIYPLTFTCPETRAGACAGGDHDYITFPTKAKTRYLIATFDLQLCDTSLDLYWGDGDHPLTSNDDAYPPDDKRGIPGGFASVVRWVAPSDGWAVVRVAPRTGGTPIIAPEKTAGAYRFAVALAGSMLAQQLEQRLAEQAGVPPVPSPAAASNAPSSGGTSGGSPGGSSTGPVAASPETTTDVTPGQAVVQAASTALRAAPNPKSDLLDTLAQETLVTLKGQASGFWVRVEVPGGVLPGWVDSRHLRRLDSVGSPAPQGAAGEPPVVTGSPNAVVATPTAGGIQLTRLDPLPPTMPTAAPPRTVWDVTVVVVPAPLSPTTSGSNRTPTPIAGIANLRVQFVDAFGTVLTEYVTPSSGQVQFSRDLPAGSAVFVRLPSAGIQLPLGQPKETITIAIPTGGS